MKYKNEEQKYERLKTKLFHYRNKERKIKKMYNMNMFTSTENLR